MIRGIPFSMLLLSVNYYHMLRCKGFLFVFILSVLFSSCGINSEFMFRAPKDFVFDVPVIDSTSIDYRIQPNDVVSFELFTNEGALLIEVSTSSGERQSTVGSTNIEYLVNSQGFVEFPVIGVQKLSGLTIAEAQDFIEDLYTPQFNRPYVQFKVLNRRAIVFTSPAGQGQVLQLGSESISLIEAIAKSGGLGQNAEADNIKLFRKSESGERLTYQIDLSTIDGIRYADMSVEAGDIIYVQTRKRVVQQVSAEIRSWIILFTGIVLLVTLPQRIQ
jgi:polysaccharide export outer membrane protein